MRDEACRSWVRLALEGADDFVFLTGDLGFRALEPLRDALGERFVNAGVAEQNMVSVAAGLASQGFSAWAYSIAPFCYARPYEQIRNDVCLHRLPVKLVGNGGGYAYGAMGATHHGLEDYGALLPLPGMRVFVPAFAADVEAVVRKLAALDAPAYLRLGRCEAPADFTPKGWSAWRRVLRGTAGSAVVVGPLAGGLLARLRTLPRHERPTLWLVGELPIDATTLPEALLDDLGTSPRLLVAEEHVESGGLGHALAKCLLERGVRLERFEHAHARGYPSGRYGSQAWHRRECGLDAESLTRRIGRLRA